jgi:hypothetical protein
VFKRLSLVLLFAACPGWNQEASPAEPEPAVRDDGRLEEAWFRGAAPFKAGKEVDFLWVKPGFDPTGHRLRMSAWEPPVLLFPGRNDKDRQKAVELTYSFPLQLRSDLGKALAGRATLSGTEGDWQLVGRFVDANAGSDVTRLLLPVGPGTASATWDLKIVDALTGELLLGVHHRCLSGSAFTGIQDKLEKWSRKFARNLQQGTLQ